MKGTYRDCQDAFHAPGRAGLSYDSLLGAGDTLNHNGPSGVEKAYKGALGKLKKGLYSSAYGRWLSIQKDIRKAKPEAEADNG